MTALARINLFFPVMRLRGQAVYGTPRQATAFEMTLLEMIDELGGHPFFSQYPLWQLFEEYLGVPEAERFVGPTLINLLRQGMVRRGEEHTRQPLLADLGLTVAGRAMLDAKAAVGEERTFPVSLWIDPLDGTVLSDVDEEGLHAEPLGKAVPVDDQPVDIDAALHEHMESHRPAEVGRGMRLIRFDTDTSEIRWVNRFGEIRLEGERTIRFDFGRPGYDAYLAGLDPAWMMREWLAPLIRLEAGERLPEPLALAELGERPEALFFPRFLDDEAAEDGDGLVFLRFRPDMESHLECRPNSARVVFEYRPETAGEGIEWRPDINGAVIFLDERFPIEGGCRLHPDGRNVFLRPFNVALNGRPVALPLCYRLPADSPRLNVELFLELLDEVLELSDDLDHQLIRLFWRSADRVLDDLAAMLDRRSDDSHAKLEEMRRYVEAVRRLRPEAELAEHFRDLLPG